MFQQAINALYNSGQIIGKSSSFQEYVASQGLDNKRTAQYISVNSLSELNSELRDANCMVFRLGSPKEVVIPILL